MRRLNKWARDNQQNADTFAGHLQNTFQINKFQDTPNKTIHNIEQLEIG